MSPKKHSSKGTSGQSKDWRAGKKFSRPTKSTKTARNSFIKDVERFFDIVLRYPTGSHSCDIVLSLPSAHAQPDIVVHLSTSPVKSVPTPPSVTVDSKDVSAGIVCSASSTFDPDCSSSTYTLGSSTSQLQALQALSLPASSLSISPGKASGKQLNQTTAQTGSHASSPNASVEAPAVDERLDRKYASLSKRRMKLASNTALQLAAKIAPSPFSTSSLVPFITGTFPSLGSTSFPNRGQPTTDATPSPTSTATVCTPSLSSPSSAKPTESLKPRNKWLPFISTIGLSNKDTPDSTLHPSSSSTDELRSTNVLFNEHLVSYPVTITDKSS